MENVLKLASKQNDKKGKALYLIFYIILFHIHVMPYYVSFFFTDLFYYEPYQLTVLDLEKYSYYAMIAFLAIDFLYDLIRNKKILLDRCQIVLFILVGWLIISAFYNFGWAAAFDFFNKMAVCELILQCVFMFITASRLNERQFKQLIHWCCIPTLIVLFGLNLVSLICYYSGHMGETIQVFGRIVQLPEMIMRGGIINPNGRYAGFYGSSGILGILCIVGVTMSVYYALNAKQLFWKVVAVISALSNIIMILFSNSRTGLIAILINVFFVCSILLQRKLHYSMKKSFLVSLLIGVVLVGFFTIVKWSSFTNMVEAFRANPIQTLDSLLAGRMQLFNNALRQASAHPWIGCGWNAKVEYYLWEGQVEYVDSAHNVFVTVYMCGGLIGLLLFILFLVLCIMSMLSHKEVIHKNQMLLCMVIVVFVQCLTEQGIFGDMRYANSYLFWTFLGYLTFDRTIRNSIN